MAVQSKSKAKLIVMKNKVSDEITTAVKDPAVDLSDTTSSLPIYDENGKLLGYIALWAAATL